MLDRTHDPSRRSWVESANEPDADFPIQNLPFGIFEDGPPGSRVGVAIGDQVLDVTACIDAGLIAGGRAAAACRADSMNALMSLSAGERASLRSAISDLLESDSDIGRRAEDEARRILIPSDDVTMHLPASIGDYTDFYASIDHATNVGTMLRPDNPLLPNYKHIPIGYHGRASSIVVSGTDVRRPLGQTKPPNAESPLFGPSKMLDYESELGFFIAGGNTLGEPIPIERAAESIFGFCLVNDWSARDVQAWEYQPLGPFLAKNFATSISPWVITREAAEPYRVPARERAPGDPQPLDYLTSDAEKRSGAYNAFLEVFVSSRQMRDAGMEPFRLSRAPFSGMYWTPAQMVTHHASNGCSLRPGDLLASGTVSGAGESERGCLLELTWRGTKPVTLPSGEERRFLEDGDEIVMKGSLEADGLPRLGFGECRGTILPALA